MPGMGNTIREFKAGKLHSGSKKGPIVKNPKQAIAIGLSEDHKASKVVPQPKPNGPGHSPAVKRSQPQMPPIPKEHMSEPPKGGISEAVRTPRDPHTEQQADWMASYDRRERVRKQGFDPEGLIPKHGQRPFPDGGRNDSPSYQDPHGNHPVVIPHIPANHAYKEGTAPRPLPAHRTCGYGHDATQRQGHLRMSGQSGAHRIGKR